MDPNKYLISHNVKNTGRKQRLGYANNMRSGWEICTLNPYITVEFKKAVTDLAHTGSTLEESECFKRKMRLRIITIA